MAQGQEASKRVELTPEEFESLKTLASSPFWATYQKVLMRAEIEIRRGAGLGRGFDGMIDSWQQNGFAAGINFTITQLQALCADYDAKAKKALEKESKPKQPFKRG